MRISAQAVRAAEEAMGNVDPDASDEALAVVVADYLLSKRQRGHYHLSILHYDEASPMEHDWRHKGSIGISTKDPERARAWIIQATLAGRMVFASNCRACGGSSPGGLKYIREKRRRQKANDPFRRRAAFRVISSTGRRVRGESPRFVVIQGGKA